MEKIKEFLGSGKTHDNETGDRTGHNTTSTAHSEGSHLAQSHNPSTGNTSGIVGGNTQGLAGTTHNSRTVGTDGVSSGNSLPRYADEVSAAEHGGQLESKQDHGSNAGASNTLIKGPHSTNTANLLDPNVNNRGTTRLEDAHEHLEGHGGGAEAADKHHSGTGGVSSELPYRRIGSQETAGHNTQHIGRDAAVAGGLVGAGYGIEEHHKHDKDLTQAERDAKKEHKHELKEEKKERKESKGSILGFLHRDKDRKYTPEEEAEFDRQEREHNATRRKSSLAGLTIPGVTDTEGDHHQHSGPAPLAEKPKGKDIGDILHGVERNRGVPGSSGFAGTEGFATGTGGALAAPETNPGPTPLAEKPKGKDIGDILHGVERNRGVPGSSGFPGTEGFGTGTGGALAASETEHHGPTPLAEKPQGKDLGDTLHGVERNRGVPGSSGFAGTEGFGTGTGGALSSSATHSGPHQTGTALGTGAVGARDSEYRTHAASSGIADSQNTPRSFDHSTPSSLSGVKDGIEGQPRYTKDSAISQTSEEGDRVPAGSSERERMIKQGERMADKDSGVAHSHAADGATNY